MLRIRRDFLTVNENWHEIQETDQNSINHVQKLCQEATLIHHNFTQQVLDRKKDGIVEYEEKNPFTDMVEAGQKTASVG